MDTLMGLMDEQGWLGDETQRRGNLSELLSNDSLGRVWLIQTGAEAIGYLVLTYSYSLEFHGRDVLLDQLYLRQVYQQPEWVTQTLNFAKAAAQALGANALHARMGRKNLPTQAIYRAAGFADDDSYLMTKEIVM
jgi:hypothetical protein